MVTSPNLDKMVIHLCAQCGTTISEHDGYMWNSGFCVAHVSIRACSANFVAITSRNGTMSTNVSTPLQSLQIHGVLNVNPKVHPDLSGVLSQTHILRFA